MVREEYISEESFEFEAGGRLDALKVVYHRSDEAWKVGDRRKVVWICHALTANSDPCDWWPQMVGDGRLLDPSGYFIVCANMIASPYGSSGPASVNPETGKPYYLDFPAVTVRDIVNANELVRRHLGIGKIDVIIGSSIGGFQAIEWSVMYPDAIANAVFMATSARVTPWLTAFNESMRMALDADPSFRECGSLKGGEAGLRCARSIALISYRSYEGYNSTQAEADPDCMFADRAASYQRYQGKKLADRFDAYSYLYLCNAVDSHNVGRGRGSVEQALGRIRAAVTAVGIDSDRLFPPAEQKFLASNIRGASYLEISSNFGHDGFLLEYGQLEKILKPILDRL
ncbi:MAG: homoserine O-acetyltransferase [Candidatus Cryptobacteroides sp.]